MDHSDHALFQAGSQTAISDRMRELLARAAQDHVYEQRTQGAVLDEIRQRLEGMEWLLREVREREIGGLNGTLESVNGRLDEITARPPTWAEGLAQHVESVRDHVDAVGRRVDAVRDRVSGVGDLPGLWTDLGAMGEGVEEALSRLRAISDGTQGVDEQVRALAEHLARLQADMGVAAHRFGRLDRALADLAQRTGRVEAGMLEASTSLQQALGTATDRVLAALDQVNAKVDQVSGRVDQVVPRIDERTAAVENRIDRLDGHRAAAGGRFDTLEERLDDIEGRVTGRMDVIDSRLSTLDGHAEKSAERLESLDERVGFLPAILGLDVLIGAQATEQRGRFDSLEERARRAEAALAPLAEMVRARPDREQLSEVLSETVEPAHADLTRRLGSLEETMLALAEALLRPVRTDKG
ncbi:hypothetical protein ACLQ2R_23735 [Streptosporangium sp. DT93]|uniref:hypothetical protein n=1 Tax=Streptosporangium sp. DT93 TaxID=3393428 RepID=UPI003CEFFEFE